MSDAVMEILGETLALLPERAVYWHRASTLLVADPHWGKAATFRAGGIPVPSGTTREALVRLDSAVVRTGAKRVVFLGDLLHAAEGRSEAMFAALGAWRASREDLSVVLVRGNHDRRAGDPPADVGIECVDAPFHAAPFVLAHHPAAHPDGYVLAGHVHPGVRMYEAGRSERLPCFVFGKSCGILPAFGDFTGLALIERENAGRIYAIADDDVQLVY